MILPPWLFTSCAMNVVLPPGAAHRSKMVSCQAARRATRARATCWDPVHKTSRRGNCRAGPGTDAISVQRPGSPRSSLALRSRTRYLPRAIGRAGHRHRGIVAQASRLRRFQMVCGSCFAAWALHGRDACATKLERVDPRKRFRRGVVPSEQLACWFITELFAPFFHEPFGMRPAERGLGNFHVGEDLLYLVRLTQIAAQNRVDKPRLRTVAGVFGEFNGFMDGGVRRNAVEPEDLIEAEPEEVLQGWPLLADRVGFAGNQAVERGLPADHPADQFMAKAAIRRGEAGGRQRGFQQILQ